MSNGRKRPGVTSIASVKGFIVMSAKAENSNELALFSTSDTNIWHKALFHGDHPIEEDAYTVLESTSHSIQVDVMTSRGTAMGTLFTSNSNGTYFKQNAEYTNRSPTGFVDFEKVAGIEGIILVNTVANHAEVEESFFAEKKRQSRISFDAGNDFKPLLADDEELHLHSVTEAQIEHRSGKIFSTAAPGIVMGVGNVGDYLTDYNSGHLYVSHDAGRNWKKALDGPHLYEIGDQGSILVAINNNETDKFSYSKNFGEKWEDIELGKKVIPFSIQTISGASGMKFLVTAYKKNNRSKWFMFQLDFEDVYDKTCKKGDFEDWSARLDEDGKPTCIMGQKISFKRRKIDAECAIREEFKKPEPKFESCKCTKMDYECDYNFDEDDGDCKPVKALPPDADECKNPKDTFKGPSGWRLIPGDKCKEDDSLGLEDPVEWPCDKAKSTPQNNNITATIHPWSVSRVSHQYLERTDISDGDDETLILLTSDHKVQLTRDHGKTWDDVTPPEASIRAIYQNPYARNHVYFLTDSKRVYYSHDRFRKQDKLKHYFEVPSTLPQELAGFTALRFHPEQPDWLLWNGEVGCPDDCHIEASYTVNGGVKFEPMMRRVKQCQFINVDEKRNASREHEADDEIKRDQLIFCTLTREEDSDRMDLYASYNFFKTKDRIKENAVSFATMSEYTIIAARDEEDEQWLKVFTSVDGETVAHAKFPPKLQLDHKSGYTVLESSTHSIFLHVTDYDVDGHRFGHILKSNSNGTDYVLSAANANRGRTGYVDFEKMQGLEGVAFINVVGNSDDVRKNGAEKKLKSKITHSDGADWSFIKAPAEGIDGKKLKCSNDEKCSLHLYNFNERFNPGHSHSSSSAVGLMLANGNVGEFLTDMGQGDTYITRDGGKNWFTAREGHHLWEYGDQGSIIVVVKWNEPTDFVSYTLDEGRTWKDFKFAEDGEKFSVSEITTVPSDTSFNFLLWTKAKANAAANDLKATINLDFSSVYNRACELDPDNPVGTDYELWDSSDEDMCIFGHRSEYIRKRPDVNCYNDRRHELLELHKITENCTCTADDYEW
jgi:hypothetical protein